MAVIGDTGILPLLQMFLNVAAVICPFFSHQMAEIATVAMNEL